MIELISSSRYLAGTLGALEITIYKDGTKTNPASAGTVTVKDALGVTLSSGAAIIVGGNGHNASGMLRYVPSAAAVADVNRLTVTWANVVLGTDPAITLTSRHEVVGDLLFTEAEARAYDGGALADQNLYPDALIRTGHDLIADAFEAILGFGLGRRYYVETLSSDGGQLLRLVRPYVHSVRSIEERALGSRTYTAWSSIARDSVFVHSWGMLEREGDVFLPGVQRYRIGYEAGKEIAGELRRAGLMVLRNQLVRSNIPSRALFQTTEQGQFRLAVAGDNQHWFGLPDVDAVLARHREAIAW